MDDPNITMEEYIRLEEEKAQSRGETFNWQTATFGNTKKYEDENDYSIDFETKFPAIVFDNTSTSDATLSYEPTVSPPDINKVDFKISLDKSDDEDYTWLRYQTEEYTIGIVHDFEWILKTIWDRSVNRVYILDFEGLTPEIRQDLAMRLRMVYTGKDGQQDHTWSRRWHRLGMEHTRLRVRGLSQKGDLRDYWTEISFDQYFLRSAPSYVLIRDPVRRLCYRMIVCTIYGRGQGSDKVTGVDLFYLRTMDRGTANVSYLLTQYLFRHAEGRKSEARLSGGHFIRRLIEHFGLVSDEGLRGLTIISRELPVIDLHELARLNIYGRRLRHIHSSLSPRLCRRGSRGLRKRCVIYGKVLLAYEEWLRALLPSRLGSPPGCSRLPYQRRVRPRKGEASTSAPPHTNDQPDP
nr:hypothetical protein [Tanacetum cinerariifolium]